MLIKDIYNHLNNIAPFSYQEEWDNSGLLLGDMNADANRILVTLDVTDEVVEQAIQAKADLIISHHPLIFSPVSKINSEDFITRRILKLANNNINYIAMHTNMDATGLSEVADAILQIKRERAIEVNINQNIQNAENLSKSGNENDEIVNINRINPKIGMGSIGKFMNENGEEVDITLREAVIRTKKGFGLDIVKVYGDPDRIIRKVAVCTGAGKSMIEECIKEKCDLLITGDITYHAALDAHERDLCIIDATHFKTEIIFVDLVCGFFDMNFPQIKVIPSVQKEVGEYM